MQCWHNSARPQQILKDSGKLDTVVARRITYELSVEAEARVRKRISMYKEQMESAMNKEVVKETTASLLALLQWLRQHSYMLY